MAADVQIRRFKVSEQAALLAFLRVAYADEPRKSDGALWRWHYLDNPYTAPAEMPLWVVCKGPQIVGQLATIPVDLKVGGANTRAIWVLDFVVLPEYRGRGLGKRLVLAAREAYPVMLTLGINAQSTAVFRSLNWVALGGVQRYQRLLYPGDALREFSKFAPLRRLINLAYAPFRPRAARLTLPAGYVVRAVTTFGAEFADLWDRASAQWPCAVVRSPAYLEWQFARQPGKQFDVLGLYRHDRLVGYVVLFFRKDEGRGVPPKAAISDLCYDANDATQVLAALLRAALSLALARRAGSLVTDVLDPLVEAQLRRHGFWQIKAAPQFMASALEYEDLIYTARNWFLTRGDSDVSIFEQPNL